jgi:hypothetical protein
LFQNVNGLKSKITELLHALATISFDIIALVETNLTPDILDSELGFHDFTVFRCDRSTLTSRKSCGGGSLIAVHKSISCSSISPSSQNTESVFVKLNHGQLNTVVGCVYIPPNLHHAIYNDFCLTAEEAFGYDYDNILLLGDFNLPNTVWTGTPRAVDESSRCIIDLANFYDLKQVNRVLNFRGVTLDLVFSSIPGTEVTPALDSFLPEDIHHPALEITVPIPETKSTVHTKFVYDFRKCNFEGVFDQIQALNLPLKSELHDAEQSFSLFCNQLSLIITQNTPKKRVVTCNFPKWFSIDLRNLVIRKKIAHKKFKTTGSIIDLDHFRSLRRQCKALTKECYESYIGRVEDSIPQNIKSFWSHVSNLKGVTGFPPSITLNGREAHEPVSKCNLFADHFSSVFCNDAVTVPSFDFVGGATLSSIEVSATEVQKKLDDLDPSKGAGPDGIPPIVLKLCSPILAAHLTIFFNALLSSGIFPSVLKQGFVVPVFKSGDRGNVMHYRPIVIQSALAKVYESLVLDYLYPYLRKYIVSNQHGFLRGCSTVTNLLTFHEYVTSAFINSRQVDCIYLDYSKAFDKVHHGLLVAKLAGYGIGGHLLKWLESYLQDRELLVKCEGAFSMPFRVISGVPQGSHLGPLLFNIFVNDLAGVLSEDCLLFADDLKIFARISSSSDQVKLQQSLNSVETWCADNAMVLNVSKCHVMSFSRLAVCYTFNYSIGGVNLRRVDSVKDLGVVFTSTLSPAEHIDHVISRANSILGFIFRTTRSFRSPLSLLTLYKSLVRPILEYGSTIWSPYQLGHINLLNRVQIRFLRVLGVRLGYEYSASPILELQVQFDVQPLHLRRQFLDLIFLYKLVNGIIDSPQLLQEINFLVPRRTRSLHMFAHTYHRTNYAYNSGLARLQRLGNEVSPEIDFFHEPLSTFRRKVMKLLF